jgi:hypothetical protein
LNADGRLDVALASGDLMLGNGDGTFMFGGRFDFGPPLYSSPNSVLVAELSGDGLPDILTSSQPGQVWTLTNRRTSVNTRPTVDAGPDRTIEFADIVGEDCGAIIIAVGADADAHYLSYEWRDPAGEIVSESYIVPVCTQTPGSRVFTVTVRDGRGGVATDTVKVTRVLTKEIVLWAADVDDIQGQWSPVADPTAAGGVRLYDPNLGAPKVNTPVADPFSRVLVRFYPEPTLTYKLWVRLKADGNSWANDSVWLQFSVPPTRPVHRNIRCSAPPGWRSISRSALDAASPAGAGRRWLGCAQRERRDAAFPEPRLGWAIHGDSDTRGRRLHRPDRSLGGEIPDDPARGREERRDDSAVDAAATVIGRASPRVRALFAFQTGPIGHLRVSLTRSCGPATIRECTSTRHHSTPVQRDGRQPEPSEGRQTPGTLPAASDDDICGCRRRVLRQSW